MTDEKNNNDRERPAPAPEPLGAALRLAEVTGGQEVVFVTVRGGRGLSRRLAEVGLIPGTPFRVLSSGKPGPFIIAVRGCRMMLGHGMVRRVWVRPVQRET